MNTSTAFPPILRNWKFNDLLHTRCWSTLSWTRTLKTSTCTSPSSLEPSDNSPKFSPRTDLRGENKSHVPRLRRHIHQLFRQLRRTTLHTAQWSTVRKDLGHFDSLVRGPSVDLSEHFHQLVPHLRHKHIEKWIREDVDVLLRGAPQNPFLWPDLKEPVRPGGKHPLVVVQVEVQRACRPGGSIFRSRAV